MVTGAAIAAMAAVAIPALGASRDRNHDGIPDRWERRHHLSLNKNQARRDQDHDKLRNRGEFRARMDPRDADTDDDGVEDGDEGAGVIDSFNAETGKLVINLFGGETVSGWVTDETEIECENDDCEEPGEEPGDEPGEEWDEEKPGDEWDEEKPGDEWDEEKPGDEPEGDEPGGEEPGDRSDDGEESDEESDDESGEKPGEEDDCTVDDLEPGRVVREAELKLSASGLVFTEIELRLP